MARRIGPCGGSGNVGGRRGPAGRRLAAPGPGWDGSGANHGLLVQTLSPLSRCPALPGAVAPGGALDRGPGLRAHRQPGPCGPLCGDGPGPGAGGPVRSGLFRLRSAPHGIRQRRGDGRTHPRPGPVLPTGRSGGRDGARPGGWESRRGSRGGGRGHRHAPARQAGDGGPVLAPVHPGDRRPGRLQPLRLLRAAVPAEPLGPCPQPGAYAPDRRHLRALLRPGLFPLHGGLAEPLPGGGGHPSGDGRGGGSGPRHRPPQREGLFLAPPGADPGHPRARQAGAL